MENHSLVVCHSIDAMELFVVIKKYLKIVGIQPNQHSNFNWMNSLIVLSLLCGSVGMMHFVVFGVENIVDFGNSFYGASSGIFNLISLPINIMKTNKIFRLIKNLEQMISESGLTQICFTIPSIFVSNFD